MQASKTGMHVCVRAHASEQAGKDAYASEQAGKDAYASEQAGKDAYASEQAGKDAHRRHASRAGKQTGARKHLEHVCPELGGFVAKRHDGAAHGRVFQRENARQVRQRAVHERQARRCR